MGKRRQKKRSREGKKVLRNPDLSVPSTTAWRDETFLLLLLVAIDVKLL